MTSVLDVDGHDLAVGDAVEIVSAASAQKVGRQAKVDSVGQPLGYVDLRWNEHSSGGANHWRLKGEHVRFLHRLGHDCALCAIQHVHGL